MIIEQTWAASADYGPVPFEFPWESMMPEKLEEKFPILSTTVGTIITVVVPYVFTGAGIALFIYLVLGAFQFLTSGGEPKAVEGARNKITNAIIGFVIIFTAFLLMKVLESVLGLPSPIEE